MIKKELTFVSSFFTTYIAKNTDYRKIVDSSTYFIYNTKLRRLM